MLTAIYMGFGKNNSDALLKKAVRNEVRSAQLIFMIG